MCCSNQIVFSAEHEWLAEPENMTATQGSPVRITCQVSNLGEDDIMVWTSRWPELTLFFNDLKLDGTPDSYFVEPLASGYTLVIPEVGLNDSREFACSVRGWQERSMTLSVLGEQLWNSWTYSLE